MTLPIIAISGRSGSGMTTLCDELGKQLAERGLSVACISCTMVADAAIEAAFAG